MARYVEDDGQCAKTSIAQVVWLTYQHVAVTCPPADDVSAISDRAHAPTVDTSSWRVYHLWHGP